MCAEHEHKAAQTYQDSGLPRVLLNCTVNGENVSQWIDPTMSLLHFLRHELNLLGTKEGCGEGECGACTIIFNGRAVNSCLVLAQEAEGSRILTVEGLGQEGQLSILQQEFIKEDALQCGFCTPGMLMSARALLDRNPEPEEEEIKEAIAGNLCRCTGYYPIIEAIKKASEREKEASQR
ncbi:2Fe-2S ferredoxin-type iron-sulfur binding domain protein [Acididesulfobacillus acetoxydans]|uniref:2Fe-2S ferredoxin-type iron-sulfur binding domain protein n=1 Tax=Acididesulfobacillus acetoxydans TaxID=1561005 RepID=A0A8S0VWJ5_9FIRM|nr:(2Fe-2S)-binding protein [Acididesulfobacillus acetoxydans]CAA7600943.1 2Fe-2S ferredoxin-type iron-sulfur binding domain protein [Acididesulfobacillus acetoxydans]CEJ08901.1 2Fe-2S iron-sulfur cluster binding domain-containing protein [Acididesulfobacillus acetoxydans]